MEQKTSGFKNLLYRVFCGFFIGISVFAPGVSGSVMAVMMGIYKNLINIISSPFKNFKKNFIYLLPMGIGAVISLVLFVLIFSNLFDNYPKATYLLFMGLIAGNIPVIYKEAAQSKLKLRYIIGAAFAFAVALCLGIARLKLGGQSDSAYVDSLLYLGICGGIAGASSMVPGISISMILMLLGVYDKLMHSAKSIDILVIAVVGICFVVAMVAFSRFTKFIFKKFGAFANYAVFGFMCGSLASIFINLPKNDAAFSWWIGVPMILCGLAVSVVFFLLSKKLKSESNEENEENIPVI